MSTQAETPFAGALGAIALCAALVAGLPPAAAAGESAPAAPAPAAATTAAAQTYAVHGVTITWNLETKRFEAPTAEQAAQIAEEFRRAVETRLADGGGALAPIGVRAQEVMPDGTVKMRLTPDLLSTSIVRVDAAGKLVAEACVDGPAAAAKALQAPPAAPALEEE